MKEYNGLENLTEDGGNIYCPDCGNYLEVVSNGWFHGQLFYCKKEKKVFSVYLRNITKTSNKEFIEQCEYYSEVKDIKGKINKKNYKEIKRLIDNTHKE